MTRHHRAPWPIDSPELGHALEHCSQGVAVVTGQDDQDPLGFTCASVIPVSTDPFYVSFRPGHTAAIRHAIWSRIRATGRMCINILAENQRSICAQFGAGTGQDFTEIDWSPAGNGTPRLHHTVATIEADLEFEYGTGDDAVVTARVTALTPHGGRPLLFCDSLRGLASLATNLD